MKTCYLVTTAVDIVGGECNCVSDISTVFLDEDKVMPENSVVHNGTEKKFIMTISLPKKRLKSSVIFKLTIFIVQVNIRRYSNERRERTKS